MARKRYSDEDALKILREIDVHLHDGLDVVSACRKAGISDKTYYYWRKKFGGLGRPQLSEMRALKMGKLPRHWDVVQTIPEEFAHDNGMF